MSPRFPNELIETMLEANKIVTGLDQHVRAEAFRLLIESRALVEPSSNGKFNGVRQQIGIEAGATEFFHDRDIRTPADNVIALAAFVYGKYGLNPFSLDDIRELAVAVGLTIPTRVDMTLLTAKREGKALFRRQGHGRFSPTVHGELHFQNQFNVSKGTYIRQESGELN
jgi:hypothetical protein